MSEHGQVPASEDGPEQAPPDGRRASSPVRYAGWLRLGAAAAVTGGLVWAATAVDGGTWLSGADPTLARQQSTAPAPAAYVESAALACPGPDLLGGGPDDPEQQMAVAGALAPSRLVPVAAAPDDGAENAGTVDAERQDDAESAEADGADGQESAGGAVLAASEDGPELDLARTGTRARELTIDSAASAVLHADGALAPGVVGGQLGISAEPGTRGLTLTPCTPPAEAQWLVGGGGAPGQTEHLVLTNPGSDPVGVDVSVFGTAGPADTTGASGHVVPPGGRTVLLLDALAAGVEAPAVRVESRGGPVVAHLGTHHRDGTVDLGADLVQPAAAPATDLVVPALLSPRENDAGSAGEVEDLQLTVRLVAPGEQSAIVELTALTEDGAVRLSGQVTRVPAGHTVDVLLEDLPEGAVALRVRSDTPVTAGARLDAPPSGDEPIEPPGDDAAATTGPSQAAQDEPLVRPAGDLAWVTATPVAPAPVGMALPDRSAIPDASATLAVTAVDATTATVHLLRADGTVRTEQIERLGNDTTVVLELPQDVRAVWVRPDDGMPGVVASVLVAGADRVGPYRAAATLAAVPWQRELTEITIVHP